MAAPSRRLGLIKPTAGRWSRFPDQRRLGHNRTVHLLLLGEGTYTHEVVQTLHAARGRSNARIARETGLHLDTVRAWRGRFAHGGLPALADRKRSGRPARFAPVQVAEAKAPACQLPQRPACHCRAGPARSWLPS
ncbi:helix-turn-helix domain-containing protein [Streptomyces sp. NPDC058655]|uniref:helix-turn-helix domain-containing protein n=1 Tax=unclassified Streptomyces TaxID=2593676 RepID=UPI00365B6F21